MFTILSEFISWQISKTSFSKTPAVLSIHLASNAPLSLFKTNDKYFDDIIRLHSAPFSPLFFEISLFSSPPPLLPFSLPLNSTALQNPKYRHKFIIALGHFTWCQLAPLPFLTCQETKINRYGNPHVTWRPSRNFQNRLYREDRGQFPLSNYGFLDIRQTPHFKIIAFLAYKLI